MGFYATGSCPATSLTAHGHSARRASRLRARRHPTPKAICPERQVSESGTRSYSPRLGRWGSKDLIAEEGGPNEYAFARNATIDRIDDLGLSDCSSSQYTYNTVSLTSGWTMELGDPELHPVNPLYMKDKAAGFRIDWKYRFGTDSDPTKQVWQLNFIHNEYAFEATVEGTTKCYRWTTIQRVLDYAESVGLNTVGVPDEQSMLLSDEQKSRFCYAASVNKIVVGFAPQNRIITPLYGKIDNMSQAEYLQYKADMIGPKLETSHNYLFVDYTKCRCCSSIPKLRAESLSWPGLSGSPWEKFW